eukprot:scaffold22379_cov145-Isochrysis_galbana.AAC.1
MPASKTKRGGGGGRAAVAPAGKFRPQGGHGAHDASAAPQEQSLRRARAVQTLLSRRSRGSGGSSAEALRLRLQLSVALRNGGEIERAAKELLTTVNLDANDSLHAHRLAAPLLLFLGRTEEVRPASAQHLGAAWPPRRGLGVPALFGRGDVWFAHRWRSLRLFANAILGSVTSRSVYKMPPAVPRHQPAAELLARFSSDTSAAARCCSLLASLALYLAAEANCEQDACEQGAVAAVERAARAAFDAAFEANWRA